MSHPSSSAERGRRVPLKPTLTPQPNQQPPSCPAQAPPFSNYGHGSSPFPAGPAPPLSPSTTYSNGGSLPGTPFNSRFGAIDPLGSSISLYYPSPSVASGSSLPNSPAYERGRSLFTRWSKNKNRSLSSGSGANLASHHREASSECSPSVSPSRLSPSSTGPVSEALQLQGLPGNHPGSELDSLDDSLQLSQVSNDPDGVEDNYAVQTAEPLPKPASVTPLEISYYQRQSSPTSPSHPQSLSHIQSSPTSPSRPKIDSWALSTRPNVMPAEMFSSRRKQFNSPRTTISTPKRSASSGRRRSPEFRVFTHQDYYAGRNGLEEETEASSSSDVSFSPVMNPAQLPSRTEPLTESGLSSEDLSNPNPSILKPYPGHGYTQPNIQATPSSSTEHSTIPSQTKRKRPTLTSDGISKDKKSETPSAPSNHQPLAMTTIVPMFETQVHSGLSKSYQKSARFEDGLSTNDTNDQKPVTPSDVDIGSLGWIYQHSSAKNDPETALLHFLDDWAPRWMSPINHTQSTHTREPAFYDLHMHKDLRLERVCYAPGILDELKFLTESVVESYPFPFPKVKRTFPSPKTTFLHYQARRIISQESSLQHVYQGEVAEFCGLVASTLLFQLPKWAHVFQWTTDIAIGNGGAADGLMTIRKELPATLPPTFLSEIQLLRRWKLDAVVHQEVKSLIAGRPELLQTLSYLSRIEGGLFTWDECTLSNMRCGTNITAGSRHWSRQSGEALTVTGHRNGPDAPSRPSKFPFVLPCHSSPTAPDTVTSDMIRNARHIVQQTWAQAVRNDTTWFEFNAGNYSILAMRDRASKTLYVSDVINITQYPGYARIQIGLYIAGYRDAVMRATALNVQLKSRSLPPSYFFPFYGSEGDISTLPNALHGINLEDLKNVYPAGMSNHEQQRRDKIALDALRRAASITIVCLDAVTGDQFRAVDQCFEHANLPSLPMYRRRLTSVGASEVQPDPAFTGGETRILLYGTLAGATLARSAKLKHITRDYEHLCSLELVVKLTMKMTEEIFSCSGLVREYRAYHTMGASGSDSLVSHAMYGLFRGKAAETMAVIVMDHAGKSLQALKATVTSNLDNGKYPFPQNWEGFYQCLSRAHERGILYGASFGNLPSLNTMMLKGTRQSLVNWTNSETSLEVDGSAEEILPKRRRLEVVAGSVDLVEEIPESTDHLCSVPSKVTGESLFHRLAKEEKKALTQALESLTPDLNKTKSA